MDPSSFAKRTDVLAVSYDCSRMRRTARRRNAVPQSSQVGRLQQRARIARARVPPHEEGQSDSSDTEQRMMRINWPRETVTGGLRGLLQAGGPPVTLAVTVIDAEPLSVLVASVAHVSVALTEIV